MTQTIKIFPSPSVKPENYETKPQKFGDLIQRETHLSFINGSYDFDQDVNCFNKNIRRSNSFISCVLECYNKHIPLQITPDVIYVAILVQFCTYINTRAKLTSVQKFFTDASKKFDFSFNSGNPSSIKNFDFEMMFDSFLTHVKSTLKIPELVDIFDCNFTTSTKKDKIVAKFLLAATLKNYYSYYGYPSCGIPHIEILGSQSDWKIMLENCEQLEQYDYGDGELLKWLKLVYPILHQFIDVYDAKNPSENEFWSKMVRHITGGSGVDHIDGWLTAFTFFRLNCLQNYSDTLCSYESYSLTHNGEKVVYPFVHYNLISNGNVSFDVNLCGWGKNVKAEVCVGQFFYSVINEQLKPENDWFVVADVFENATLKLVETNDWAQDIQCEINPNKKLTYFQTPKQVLHLLDPIYQKGHWEQPKFIDGPIDDFLHFFVSAVDECYVDDFESCVKCYQKGCFEVEVFQGSKFVDYFQILRTPLQSCINDCVGAPYVIPILRQWLENNYEYSGFPMFKNADNGRSSLGHIIYQTFDRPIDGTMLMLRLEIPLSKMKKLHQNFDHSEIDQFNKDVCICSLKNLKHPNDLDETLQFCITPINKCQELISPEEFKANKCWYCLPPYAFKMDILLNKVTIDIFVIISEKPMEMLYPFQQYQYIYQWMLNNFVFDSQKITKFNLMPLKKSLSYDCPITYTFYIDAIDRVKLFNPQKRWNLPIWKITDESVKDFKKALCYCNKNNLINLECKIIHHPIFENKSTLMWKITTKSFDHQGYHIQRPSVKAGSLMMLSDDTPEKILAKTFNFDSNCLNLIDVDQQLRNYLFEIPLKVCEENFGFNIK